MTKTQGRALEKLINLALKITTETNINVGEDNHFIKVDITAYNTTITFYISYRGGISYPYYDRITKKNTHRRFQGDNLQDLFTAKKENES